MQADYVLDYDMISVEKEQRLFLMFRVRAKLAPDNLKRPPLNLSVVLDRSGSMAGDKLAYVKKATQFLLRHLGAQDTISAVTYGADARVEIEPQPCVHKDMLHAVIDKIHVSSMTNLSGGWLQGCQLITKSRQDGQNERVLLLTDGLANQGVTDPEKLEQLARQKREEGITTTTMGVGMDFNEDLLRRMAAAGGGAFYFIDNPDQAPVIFQEELKDLLSVVGQNLTITLRTEPFVQFVMCLNTYSQKFAGDALTFNMGDLYADEIKTLLLELAVPRLKSLGEIQVASAQLDYDELTEEGAVHRTLYLPVMVNVVAADDFAGHTPNAEVVKAALLLRAARAREESIRHADRGDFETASQVLTSIAEEIYQSHIEDAELQTQHDMLREEAVDMELGSERYDSYTRKTTTTKSFFSERTSRFMTQTELLHTRLKQSRPAVERNAAPPTSILWNRNQLDLTAITVLRIGRHEDNEIVLDENSVSKHHCQIERHGDDLFLIDLDSRNGTFANGGELEPGISFRLSHGDVFTVGKQLFRLD